MKILIPTDYSKNALLAFEYVHQIYGTSDVEYIFLNVQNARHAGAILTVDPNKELIKKSHVTMDALVHKIREENKGLIVQGIVTAGTFIDSVIEKADELSAQIVAIGTRGAGGVESVLMGSSAASLIGHCNRPLFVVPDKAKLTPPMRGLLAADFVKDPKPETYDTLLDICYEHNSHLDILHVAKPNEPHFTEKDIPFNTETLDYTIHERIDSDTEYAIIDFVQTNTIDLIAIIKSKGEFIHDLFHSSLTKKLGMHSDTPLLVLH